jgi:signal transduction histidine kinase
MRLSEFILSNLDSILSEWDSFAATIVPEHDLDKIALRDHAKEILQTIAADMETAQSSAEQEEKSQGRGARPARDSAAETHTADRIQLGFNQVQVVSEYRALRATVIRLWIAGSPTLNASSMRQVIRFNEAIDQALSESNARFMRDIERARDFALGILAHDLRSPLQAIATGAELLAATGNDDEAEINAVASQIIESTNQMNRLIGSLLDFTRTRLGQRLPLNLQLTDLTAICRQSVAELRAAHPARTIEMDCPRHAEAVIDGTRISQMLSNLVSNALQHGAKSKPVSVLARVEGEEIILRVHNEGTPIPAAALPTLFECFPRRTAQGAPTDSRFSHLGLGLYVVRQIVEAHSGQIDVTSTAQEGTTFTVKLPRRSVSS